MPGAHHRPVARGAILWEGVTAGQTSVSLEEGKVRCHTVPFLVALARTLGGCRVCVGILHETQQRPGHNTSELRS